MRDRLLSRLLSYGRGNTQAREDVNASPSSEGQNTLLSMLKGELEQMRIHVTLTEHGCLYANIEASEGYEHISPVGFVAHVDTSPDFSGEGVAPEIHEDYDGGDIITASGRVIGVRDFPHLARLRGHTVITSGGDTLLGADDKAGVAEIMCAIERIIEENIPHGRIVIAFTPDEEIGMGTAHFDIERFGCEFAYTLDGSAVGEIEYENFNAARATVRFAGNNVHPGTAKGVMINAARLAAAFDTALPSDERPENTEGYEGFYHLCSMSGDVESALLEYILRDHDRSKLEEKKERILSLAAAMCEQYGEGRVRVEIREQYSNMASIINRPENRRVLDIAKRAITECGLSPVSRAIRGGTDGASISYMGVPCPNLGTGGYAFHGPFEHASLDEMSAAAEIILRIVAITREG